MIFSHRFGSLETLNRARFWLTWHGFTVQEPRESADPTTRSPRLAVKVPFSAQSAARALIDSIEHSDPDAFPTLFDTKTPQRWVIDQPQIGAGFEANSPHGSPIHWQSRDDSAGDLDAARVAEYMLSRWE